ncbi:MAG: ATP-binding cassette domain-containing protein [Solirubrobacteraceae bacterium]|nr:ATP-binding cassette domain-containing protein [Solirubrobacteraceae bacterium]
MIEAHSLTKRFGSATAVTDVSFACQPGTVTGFVGPNGAGKSTTLRMICGLARPDEGTALVDGVPFAELPRPMRTVGALLEASALHPGRSGLATLKRACTLADMPADRPQELLRLVGLEPAAWNRRVGDYSLGMRQRLGIAQALVGDPRILILDEPANGLDPEGIRWMRSLLRDFADRGGTVLLSSHLLAEVQATVDRLVVIGGGRIVASGALDELLHGTGTLVRAVDPAALEGALRTAGVAFTRRDDGALSVEAGVQDIGLLAARAGVALTELRQADGGDLEDLFFTLTGGETALETAA